MKKKASKKTPSAKRSAVTKSAAKRATPRAASAKSGARSAKSRAKSTASTARKPGPRADFGQPIDGFFAKQPRELRAILEALRKIVEEVAPDATASLKWGMPFYSLGGAMMCALGGHKSHVNLILAGPPGTFSDPEGRLQGEGKTGRRLTLRKLNELPREAVRGWVRSAMHVAQAKG